MISTIKVSIFHRFYKGLRKKNFCGCSGVGRATFPLQPQMIIFRKSCKTNCFSNILRTRRTQLGRAPLTSSTRRQNPIVRALFGEEARKDIEKVTNCVQNRSTSKTMVLKSAAVCTPAGFKDRDLWSCVRLGLYMTRSPNSNPCL